MLRKILSITQTILMIGTTVLSLTTPVIAAVASGPQPAPASNLPDDLQQAILGSFTYLEQKVTALDGAGFDHFGNSVALSGNTALVGAFWDDLGGNTDQGSVYVFVRSGATWVLQQKLTASDGATGDWFGASVALDGDTALVGAENDGIGANKYQGSAYVFVRSGTVWTQQAKLTALDAEANDYFGASVALSGNTALVGAIHDDVGTHVDQGSATVFVRSGTAWKQQAQLTAPDGGVEEFFSISVALSDDTALVGVACDDIGGKNEQGSAYVFVRSGTTWSKQALLTAPDGAAADFFGISVALSGDTALVGADYGQVGGNAAQGSAYVFTRSGIAWSLQQKLTASDGAANDHFGVSVALDGGTALVGAPMDRVGANTNQGSAYVFTRSGTAWTQQARLTASDGAAGDSFGSSAAVDGDTTLVAAEFDVIAGNAYQGSTYFYERTATTRVSYRSLGANDGWILESSENSNRGGTMSSAGSTFYVGDNGQRKQYRAILSFGTASLPDNAIIIKVKLKLKLQGVTGTSPFTAHGNLLVDIKKGPFSGDATLQLGDFQITSTRDAIGILSPASIGGWSAKTWTSGIFAYINKAGVTQFRLRFTKDDDNDAVADYLKFCSGNAGASCQPQLIVEYYVP